MGTRSIEISVGAFVLAGIVALVVLAVQVSGITDGGRADTYRVTARFGNVAGLALRAKVAMSGVTIGRVRDISVDTQRGQAIVGMDIERSAGPITADAGAKIVTEGVLGAKYVTIVPGGDEELLADGSVIADTQGALILEDLIGQFVSSMGK
jgi:phospholipid/cholesterol/gamma-HCH transport system substrate-binding protein